jgi:hypothetical protein
MACPCCGPKWACYQCCCPDGSAARNSIGIQVTANNEYRVPYQMFEGTYTLTLDPIGSVGVQTVLADSRARGATCLRYSFESAADNTGCRQGEPSKRIAFCQLYDGVVLTYWEFCGKDEQGRCVFAGSIAYSTLISYLCGGFSGLAMSFVLPVTLMSTGQQIGRAAFDIYIQ